MNYVMGDYSPESNLSNSGTALTLTEHDGEPRVLDIVLGKALGMNRPRDIRKLIERHADVLSRFGGVCATVAQTSSKGGRPATEYLLNEEQAVYIVTQSDAPNALETKVQVVKVFVAWRHGHLVPNDDLTRRIDGIARSTIHKVAGIEKMISLMSDSMIRADSRVEMIETAIITLAERVHHLMLAADPRVAALDYVSVRELLNEAGALPKGRNSINRKIGIELKDLALLKRPPLPVRKCPHTGVWLYQRDFAKAYMAERGNALVHEHNDRVMGQGVIAFPRRKPARKED